MTHEDHDLAQLLEPPRPPKGCPGDWTLQRYVSQELKGEALEEVTLHTARCAHCRERLSRLDHEREAFLEQLPFESMESDIAERALFLPDDPEVRVPESPWKKMRLGLVSFACGAAAMLVVFVLLPSDPTPTQDGDRIKGTTSLAAEVLRKGEPQPIEEGMTLVAGDAIEFRVDTGTYDHVVLVGIDGTGTVSFMQPASGGASAPITPGAGKTLGTAFRLDDAPGPEVYVAFLTDEPIDAAEAAIAVERWAGDAGAEAVSRHAPDHAFGGAVEVLTVHKEVVPR